MSRLPAFVFVFVCCIVCVDEGKVRGAKEGPVGNPIACLMYDTGRSTMWPMIDQRNESKT